MLYLSVYCLSVYCLPVCYLSVKITILFFYLATLAAVAWTDWHTQTIPDRFSVRILLLGLISFLLFSDSDVWLADRLAGLLSIALPMLLLSCISQVFLSRKAFGGGDIKLMAAGGFFLGWRTVLPAAFWGLAAAAIYCIWMLVKRKMTRTSSFPLGPFLAIGLAIGVLLQ